MTEAEYDKEQLRILRNAFKAFDHDGVGTIEHSDVSAILEILGQKLEPPAVKALIKEVDKGNSGKLDFSQFCKLAARFIEVEEDVAALQSELKEAFRVYDKEGKGYLTVATLRGILHELDDKISNQDLDLIIEEIDADGSGTVDFDEFMQVMTGNNIYDLSTQRRFVFEPCVFPAPRYRLHRRIEWCFERLFQQLWQPIDCYLGLPSRHVPSSRTITIRNAITHTNNKTAATDTHKQATPCCSHRPNVYRPRFPKWVPILTLYREIVQNPFRRRGRYMVTHTPF